MKKLIYLILAALILFSSCNASPEEKGLGLLRLVLNPSSEIDSYSIKVVDSKGNRVDEVNIEVSSLTHNRAWSNSFAPGLYSVYVEAKNSEGEVIFYGEMANIEVFRDKETSTKMYLDVGVGSLDFSLEPKNPLHSLVLSKDLTLERLSSSYVCKVGKDNVRDAGNIPAGHYLLTAAYTLTTPEGFSKNGEHIEIIEIKAGDTSVISSSVGFGGSSVIVIEDSIGQPIELGSIELSEKAESTNPIVDYYIPEKTSITVSATELDAEAYTFSWKISGHEAATMRVDEANPNTVIIYTSDLASFSLELLVEGKSGHRYEKGFISLRLESQPI